MSPPIRVLIVEDQPEDAELVLDELRLAGYKPDWTRVETEADYLAQLDPGPDVILADYTLPGFDALQALHLLQDRGLDIPFIVVTGTTTEEVAVECIKRGAADYLLKDRLGRLGSAVKRALDQKGLRDDKWRAEQALRLSEERFSKAFRASPIAISISTLTDGRLLDVNDGFLHLVGYRRPDVIGRTIVDLEFWADPEDRTRMLDALDDKRSVHDMETRFRTKSGEIRIGLLAAELIDLGGERCVLALIHDISERKRAEEEIRRQAARAEALVRVAARLSAHLDLGEVLSAVCEETARALNVPSATVSLYDNKRSLLVYAGGFGVLPHDREHALPVPRSLYDAYARPTGPVAVIPDVQAVSGPPSLSLYVELNVRTVAVAAMLREGQLVGSLNIATYGEVRHFTEDELALLKGLADQAALAITNAQQHESLQRRLQESEALAAISRALNQTLDLERNLQMIVDAARQIIPKAERAVIHLLDEDKQALRPAAVAGLKEAGMPDFSMRPGEGIAGLVMAEGNVINVGDIQAEPRYLQLGPATPLRSLLVAPVQSGVRRLGTISVRSAAPEAFSPDDEQLLATLGMQAALAIENARLFDIERRRAEEAEALQQVTQTIISRLELSEMLHVVVDAIATIANYKYVSVFLLEEDRLVLQSHKGYILPLTRVLRLDQGLCGRVARTGRPALVPDVTLDSDYLPDIPGVQSAIGVPLIHAGQVLGVLLIESDANRPLDDSDLNWLINAGRQLSVAIENTRLYGYLDKSLRQEKAARAQVVQAEKLAAMGRLVASVAHELNNPMQAIQNALYLVKQEPTLSPQAREDLQVALVEADRMADLISRLRETYRPAVAEQFHPVSLNALVEEVQKLIATHLRHSNVTFEFDPDPGLPLVPGFRDQLKQVILNLSMNAVEAMPSGGRLTIRTRYLPETGEALLTVADTGTGIDLSALPNIFDPFFTTKEGGTGLGLAITYDIIQHHHSRIDVESEMGRGTAFKIWLPVDNTRPPAHNPQPVSEG